MRGQKTAIAIFALAAALSAVAGQRAVGWWERGSAARIGAALSAAGHYWARVEVDGMTGALSGLAPGPAAQADARLTFREAAPRLALDDRTGAAPVPVAPPPPWGWRSL